MNEKFYICRSCGNIIIVNSGEEIPVCCGQPMEELIPNTVDAAFEKHVPVVKRDGDKVFVEVGEVLHPMTPEHSIQMISVCTEKGIQRKDLAFTDEPKAEFSVPAEEEISVYEYCNLHGLWKA